jgi:phosphoenolpyruvate carboxylase
VNAKKILVPLVLSSSPLVQVMIGYSDSGKDAGRLSAAWQMFKTQEDLVKVAKQYGVHLTMFHGRGGTVGRGGGPTHLAILSQPPDTVNGSLRVTIQGEVIEQSFGEENLCFRTLQRFTAATLEHGMHPPIAPKPVWRSLMDDMAVVATEEYRSIVFENPLFVPYFRAVKSVPDLFISGYIIDVQCRYACLYSKGKTQRNVEEVVRSIHPRDRK